MKIDAITFNGTEKTDFDRSQYSDESLELLNYYQIETSQRGDDNRRKLDLKKDQVFEFEFEDGTNWISGPDTLDDIFPELMTSAKRSSTEDGVFELPLEISTESTDRSIVGKIVLRAIKVFSKKVAAKEVKKLAAKLEDKQLEGKIGLYKLSSDFQLIDFVPDNSALPYLVLIHGTASSTIGSFGEAMGTDFMSFINETYDNRILAFQHRTLTENPIQNVKALISGLPNNCVLHLITTSRGGLVGEILSRFCNSSASNAFNSTEMAILKNEYPNSYFSEIEKTINEINAILHNKKIKIEKFIRIACPAGGTTLASKRLDFFFNITLNLIGVATGMAANPIYMAFRNLTAAVIDSKNKPEVLPGLEVQNPGSPFIKALNCPLDLDNPDGRIIINNSLVIIAGNSKPALKLNAIWIIASKLFFLRKNDLVVDTETMSLGTRRSGKVQRFFYEDNQLNHFKYFENGITNHAVLTALKSEWGTQLPGFTDEPLSVSVASDRNINFRPDGGQLFSKKATGTKPIVLLLPGIMGSNLEYDNKLLWINYIKIISGGLSDLKASNNVNASSLVSTSYKRLVEDLEDNYDVVTFPYDWRLPLEDSASLLNKKIKELMKLGQPIKLIGHSMGGVLIRDFIVLYKDTWSKLNNSDGFRLIFLGAPLNGSYRIPAVLFGMDRLIDKLSLIDLVHSKDELLGIFSGFKGLLSLLPLDGEHDFSNPETWNNMLKGIDLEVTRDNKWPVPSAENLAWFAEYKGKMKDALLAEDLKNAVYVAGRDKATPCDFRIDEKSMGKELVFLSTGEGDQSVTWDSGIPKLMIDKNSVYYANVSHGELACHADMLKGIKEILVNGNTNLFPDKRPSLRGDELLFKSPDYRDFDLSQAGVDFSVLGIGGETEPQMEMPPISVTISHGDLFYAKYPLLAGHFEDDGILSAEKEINKNLGEALNYRHSLGIYPGPIGTNELFLSDEAGFRGVIIIGLGKPENLTSSELTKTVEQGVCKYLLSFNQIDNLEGKSGNNIQLKGISSLIIGGGYGGLKVENSLKGIIQGVHNANQKIRNLNLKNTPQIGNIEFVELFEDTAVGALYSLGRIEKQETRSFHILLEEKKLHTLLGSKKRIPNEISTDWWNRITVKKAENNDTEKTVRCLTFSASTSRAYEKEIELISTPALMEGTIKGMSTNNRWTPQSAKAIFELLIPNDFKEQLKRHGNISWILDTYTAEYPWELLLDEISDTRPLCVASGMIRQLSTQNYNKVIKSTPQNNALVIADPDLKGFASQLPGALKEGQQVAAKLLERGIKITTSYKGTSDEIIEKLFCNEYRIIHLSGHGIFNEDQSKGSGMVIGNNMFLSTREIRQMSVAPELVFVNCCHIGKISGVAEELYQQRYKLAANIGTQLIENGVRCVIAAGWAVDDIAALEFANVFYDRILSGYTFGDAVSDARKSVFAKYSNTNTWGAYQCYGDPFYRFEQRRDDKAKHRKIYMISQEAEIDLLNLLNELDIGKKSTDEYIKQLEEICEGVDNAKIRTPIITEKEALVYLELKHYDKACEKFSTLLKVEDASFSFSVAEKYYNATAKKITSEFKDFMGNKNDENEIERQKNLEQKRTESLKILNKVTDDLEALVKLIPSSERLNILGSTYKRKAFVLDKNKFETYEKAALKYQEAYSYSKNWYSLTNWMALESALVLSQLHSWDSDVNSKNEKLEYKLISYNEAIGLLDEATTSLVDSERMSYWDMLAEINIGLCKYILQFSKTTGKSLSDNISQQDIYNEIGELWKKAGSKGKRFAEIEHLEFIIDALSITKNKNSNALATKLEQLKKELIKQIEI
jgi:hypothetical protein